MVPNHKKLKSLIIHTHKQVTFIQSLTLAHLAAGHPSFQDSLLFSYCGAYDAFKPPLLQCTEDGASSLRTFFHYTF